MGGKAQSKTRRDSVMRHNVLLACGEKNNTHAEISTLILRPGHGQLKPKSELSRQCLCAWLHWLQRRRLTSASVIGSFVLLTQITIMMASLCQESGRQKAGNGWESRKGSGEACGGDGERLCVSVCYQDGGREEGGQGAVNRLLLFVLVILIQGEDSKDFFTIPEICEITIRERYQDFLFLV